MPAYNYAEYIKQAVQSVLSQTMADWELIIINDGSTDNTREIIRQFKKHPRITVINQENKGLNVTNNIALRLSRGEYIMRLDADDYLDENALLVLSSTLDARPDIGLVYPDYYEIDRAGGIINLVRRKKIEDEVEILDLPAHGACTMFRKECMRQIGGYVEDFSCQDGYEIWLRFIAKYKPWNVNTPLFYYRQHPASLTKDAKRILDTRRRIKKRFVQQNLNDDVPKVLGLIPVLGKSIYPSGDPFQNVAGNPLISYTLEQAQKAMRLDRVVVASDDSKVLDYAARYDGIKTMKRPTALSDYNTRMPEIVSFVLDSLKADEDYLPWAVCLLYINTPLRRSSAIDKAVDTMMIFDVDSVISIVEELSNCYQHRRFGLKPINGSGIVHLEKEAIYKENGAIYLSKSSVFKKGQMLGDSISHIVMLPEESVRVRSLYDFWLAEKTMTEWLAQNDVLSEKANEF